MVSATNSSLIPEVVRQLFRAAFVDVQLSAASDFRSSRSLFRATIGILEENQDFM